MNFSDVALPLPIHQVFTYEIPPLVNIQPYSRVFVPFGKKKLVGVVTKIHTEPPACKTKKIETLLDDEPLFSENYAQWLLWASDYYFSSLGEVMATALPAPFFKPRFLEQLQKKKSRHSPLDSHWKQTKTVELTSKQEEVLQHLIQPAQLSSFSPTLLHGVTGSGKTEVYLRFIEEVLAQNKQVIFLVPEIGLTPQTVGRFQTVFKNRLGLYHSGLTENQRLKEWLRAKNGEIALMVGTRSALFAPFPNLGAIILDEEQDSSYKQEERFRYHARDLALVRGKIENCPVLLGSATPSLESFHNAQSGKYQLLTLPERAGGGTLPKIEQVDMASQLRQTRSVLALSKQLFSAIEENLKKKEQTLLLINRRGFARSFLCLACREPMTCPNCSVNLVYHKKHKKLRCHYCDMMIDLPSQCPTCHKKEITLVGQGTQTIEEELKTFFPHARIERLDRDVSAKRGELLRILKELKDKKIDILVGTQIIAKGHDVPSVTLVGVLGVDAGLGIPDFRASEKVFQLLMQVSGRAGRGKLPGKVIIQSCVPSHYSIRLAGEHDFAAFYKTEIRHRTELGYPPVGRLIQFQLSSTNEKKLEKFAEQFAEKLKNLEHSTDVALLGPSPATLEKIRGRFRWHLLLKSSRLKTLRTTAQKIRILLKEEAPSNIKWAVDVDPVSML